MAQVTIGPKGSLTCPAASPAQGAILPRGPWRIPLFPSTGFQRMLARSLFLLAVLAIAACTGPLTRSAAAQTAAATADSARAFIRVGTFPVAVMDLVAPPRLQALTDRFQAAARSDPAWFMEYVRANDRPGEPLPYHPKLGLGKEEYDEMLLLFDQLKLTRVADAELTVRAEGANRFVLDGGRALPELTGIVIDLAAGRVETPFGATTARGEIHASPEQVATGPWNGIAWEREELDETTLTGTVISFNLGRLQESGRGILYYDAKQMAGGTMQARASRVLTYDLR